MHNEKGIKFRFYCIDSNPNGGDNRITFVENYWKLHSRVVEDVEKLMMKYKGWHFYYQVLPLARIPDSGRGTADDVAVGKVLWADLDYKEVVNEAPFYGCKEGEDYELECFYKEGDKIIRVNRPSISTILDKLNELGIPPTIIVDSGAGYHLYWLLLEEIDAKRLSRLETKLIEYLKKQGIQVDPQTRDLARILRLPCTINQRVNRITKIITMRNDTGYTPEELEEKITPKTTEFSTQVNEETDSKDKIEVSMSNEVKVIEKPVLKELSDSSILRLKEILKTVYKPGHRHNIIYFLSGWFAKAKIHPLILVKLVKMLHEETHDENPLKEHIGAIIYTYKKQGIDMDQYAEEIIRLTGEKPYGLEKLVNEKDVKGKSGLQEELEKIVSEEEALNIVREIEEILGTASPYRDSIIEIMDYDKQICAIANLRKLIVARGIIQDNKIKYKERITVGAPTHVEVYMSPFNSLTKYKVVWETQTRPRPFVIGPAPLEDIIARLRAEGLILNRRLADDIISAIMEGFIKRGKAVIRTEIDAPGFYLIDNKIISVGYEIQKPSPEELKEALLLLNELSNKWFKHIQTKFWTVIKWYIVAPFSFIMKQKKRWMPWLYLYGEPDTGKSTLNKTGASIWGLPTIEKPGSGVSTPARLEQVLSSGTFPVMIKEPAEMIEREDIQEMIKAAAEDVLARGKFIRGVYTDIQALSIISFSSNHYVPRDPGLVKRLLIITFTYNERVSKVMTDKDIGVFRTQVEPRFSVLKALGKYVAHKVSEDPTILDNDWKTASVKLLEEAYKETGLEIPQGVYLWYENEEENVYETIKDIIRDFLIERINEEYRKWNKGYLDELIDVRVKYVLDNKLIPWLVKSSDGEYVYIRTGILEELKEKIGDKSLRSISEILGWEYKQTKIGKEGRKAIVVPLDELIEFLNS